MRKLYILKSIIFFTMIGDIIEFIAEIPAMIEFIIGVVVYLIILLIANEAVSGVAEETVCKMPGLANQILCFYITNPVVAFIVTVLIIIGIGVAFRVKFL